MSAEQGGARVPLRIELATSEAEGGRCRTWADPAQVLAVLVATQPEDTFTRYVAPRLAELDQAGELQGGWTSPDPGGDRPLLPSALEQLVSSLEGIHARLYRENRSLMREPRKVDFFAAVAEEDRIYFVRSTTSSVWVLRGERAYAVHAESPQPSGEDSALGRTERLNLEVTSLDVQPGDTVILLLSEAPSAPDAPAVRNLFARTVDLKRACDGLVNLQALSCPHAGAVAFRFLPLGTSAQRLSAENPLEGLNPQLSAAVEQETRLPSLARELIDEFEASVGANWEKPEPTPATPVETKPEADPRLAGELIEGFEASVAANWGPEWSEPPQSERADLKRPAESVLKPGGSQPVAPHSATESEERETNPAVAEQGAKTVVAAQTETDRRLLRAKVRPPRNPAATRRKGLFWPLFGGILGVVLILLAAVPATDGSRSLGRALLAHLTQSSSSSPLGRIEVAPDPPARAVLIDGEVVGQGTPTLIDSIPAGRHTLGLDLGPCGIWETVVDVPAENQVRMAPQLYGAVEVVAADPGTGGMVWTEGREKVAVPTTIESLPVGWNRLFFEDRRIPIWDRLVLVRAGETTRISVPNRFSSDKGTVKVEAFQYVDRRGMLSSEGDSIWVDGGFTGLTPWEGELAPGLHSVRIRSTAGAYTEILEVRAGGVRHVMAQLRKDGAQAIRHVPPGKVVVRGPLILSAEIDLAMGEPALHPTLHLPELPPGSREVPLSPLDEGSYVYVGVVGEELLPVGRPVSYYFTATGADGRILWSDLYRLYPQSRLSANSGD